MPHRTFSARHAWFIIKYAPRGRKAKKSIETDTRIDLAVGMYSNIKDLENFSPVRRHIGGRRWWWGP